MAKVAVYNMEGKEVDKIELNDSIFGVEVNEHLVHMAVLQQLANNRQGTQKAKTRSEVRGGGRKPWRQKGTGHARQGSTRSPQWTHGGIVFAPKPRDYRFAMNKKVRQLAIKSALSTKLAEGKLIVVDKIDVADYKTKTVVNMLKALNVCKGLIVNAELNKFFVKSAANVPAVKTALTNTINTYDILKYDTLVLTVDAVKKLEEVYA